MTRLTERVSARIVTLQPGEGVTAALMFGYSFLAMTSYNILKPITRSKFISALGADNLPYVLLIAGALIGVVMQLYSRAVALLPRSWVIPVTQAAEVALLVSFWFLFQTGADWVSVAFYLLALILGVLLISQFWTLANDIYNPRQAKRLFGFIGGGASLGGATGAGLTSLAVGTLGTNNLLLVSAGILTVCVALVTAIVRRERVTSDFSSVGDEHGVGGGEALRLLRESPHLQTIALVIGCAAIGAAIIEQQLNMAAEAAKGSSPDSITAFLARITFYLSAIGFLIQVVLTSRIHRVLGLAFALLILPVSLGSTATLILLNGGLWAAGLARVMDTSLRYTIDKTTREVLFLPLPIDLKYRAKPFVDVTVDRSAKALGALLCLVLIKPWGLGLDWRHLSYASLLVTGVWVLIALHARRQYLRAFRRSIESRTMVPAAVRLNVADAATLETLFEELANPDETRVLYAIDVLESLDRRHLVTPLLLHHESSRVRARALEALEAVKPSVAEQWIPAVRRLLNDEDPAVRAAAVHALASLCREEAPSLMRRYLRDPEPRIAVTAAVVLADSGTESDAHAAEAALARLVEDTRQRAAAARAEVAAALGRVRNPRFRPLLATLMHDGDPDVALTAVRSARMAGPADMLFVPALVSLLGHRTLKALAREVLVSYGDHVLDALAYFLTDRDEDLWVRRHIPATLALIPTQRSMDILLGALNDPDGFLRYKVIAAIEKLRRGHPDLAFRQDVMEGFVLKETRRYYGYLSLRYNITEGNEDARQTLLVRALDDKLERTLDRIYRVLGLIYPWKDVAAVRHTVASGDVHARAAALEYMDNLLHGTVRKRVMLILDETPLGEKVRHANAILKTRPRDLEDTLAQLVHDEDGMLSAAAIHFAAGRRLWALADDLEYVLNHRADEPFVAEAASWALALYGLRGTGAVLSAGPLPAVELVDRLRRIRLFDFVSIDELFRIAGTGRQLLYSAGRELYREGTPIDDVQWLLEGSVHLEQGGAGRATLAAPAALAFEEMLEGHPVRHTITAADRAVCLAFRTDQFLTMLSDNIILAQGLFRVLLDAPALRRWKGVYPAPPGLEFVAPRAGAMQPLEKVIFLEQSPIWKRVKADQLLEVAAIAHETRLEPGSVLFTETDAPEIYYLLTGEIRLGAPGQESAAGPGATIGMAETLAGVSLGQRAVVTREGSALRIEREDLLDVLAENVDLLQGIFSELLRSDRPDQEIPSEPGLQSIQPEGKA